MANVPSKKISALHERHLFVGVDGGGTKTNVVVTDGAGRLAGEGTAGPSNPLRVGVETAVDHIAQALNEACDRGGVSRGDIDAATLGLAGVRRADLRRRVEDSFRRRTAIRSVQVFTDAEIALYGTTLGKPGLVIIAGTGSICLGKNEAGEVAISGGWGPLAGDEGGGVGIAQQALHMVAKASDGRGAPTALTRKASEYFRASGPENLIVAIYSPQVDNSRIAGFARLVVETAAEGDAIAIAILKDAGRELGLAACAVIKKLGLEGRPVPMGCVGSIFNAGTLLTTPLIAEVRSLAPDAYLTQPQLAPASAAARLAIKSSAENSKYSSLPNLIKS